MNIDTLKILQGIVRREGRSLLQYIGDSFPWTRTGDTEGLARLHLIVQEEQSAVVALSGLLARRRHRLPPYLGPFPMSFTSINYATLDYVVPLLIDYQKHGIADLERDLTHIPDEQMAAELQKIVEMKRRHLQVLMELAAAKK